MNNVETIYSSYVFTLFPLISVNSMHVAFEKILLGVINFNCASLTSQVQDVTGLTLEDSWTPKSLGLLF